MAGDTQLNTWDAIPHVQAVTDSAQRSRGNYLTQQCYHRNLVSQYRLNRIIDCYMDALSAGALCNTSSTFCGSIPLKG